MQSLREGEYRGNIVPGIGGGGGGGGGGGDRYQRFHSQNVVKQLKIYLLPTQDEDLFLQTNKQTNVNKVYYCIANSVMYSISTDKNNPKNLFIANLEIVSTILYCPVFRLEVRRAILRVEHLSLKQQVCNVYFKKLIKVGSLICA